MTYEAVDQLVREGLGQSTCVGIGGDPIIGTTMKELLALFEADDQTDAIVMIGEIRALVEIEAAQYAKAHVTKPVIGFIAGQTAPPGRMGHAVRLYRVQMSLRRQKKRLWQNAGLLWLNLLQILVKW